ncbi:MAG: hypothetical protein HYS62_01140 [Candidatus Aenigmarchaeota archaeon]|nr:hypothetical protein [Candidatus Aenigmarchaeota archaeon]
MALPFLKNPLAKGKGTIPVERVRDLTGRGFSEVEVIDVLRKEGYSPEEIDNALTQSLRFAASEPARTENPAEYPRSEPALPTLEDIIPRQQQQTPQIPETSLPQEYYQGYQQNYPTEEYVDYVVQARMGDVTQKITEFSVKAQEIERRIQEVGDRINEIMSLRNAEQTQILSKIETFKEGVSDIETRMAGLEKAFKETLPALIESVRALTDLVQRLKREA